MKRKLLALFFLFLGMATFPLMEIFVPLHGKWSYCYENNTWGNFEVGVLGYLAGMFLAIVLFVHSEVKP